MKKYRIISLLVCFVMLLSSFSIVTYADNEVISKARSYGQTINVKGSLDPSYAGKKVSLVLLDKSVNLTDAEAGDVKYLNEAKILPDGTYNVSFPVPETVSPADCKIYAKVGKENVSDSIIQAISNAVETLDYTLNLSVDVATATATVAVEDDFNVAASEISYTLIMAFYNDQNRLINTKIGEANTPVLTTAIPDGTYKTKAFLFKSIETPIPICENEEKIGKKENLNVLIIGNSFSVDGTFYLDEIAEAAGVSFNKIAVIQHGGSRLSQHWNYRNGDENGDPYFSYQCTGQSAVNPVNLDYAFERGIEWDYVLIQEWRPDAGSYDDAGVWKPYIFELSKYIKEKCPNATVGLQMTWAFELGKTMNGYYDGSLNDDPAIQGIGNKQMWQNAYAFNKRAAEDIGAYVYNENGDTVAFGGYPAKIIPSGYAVQYAKSINEDGFKPFDTVWDKAIYDAANKKLLEFKETNPGERLVVEDDELLAPQDAGKIRLHRDGFHMSQAGRYLIGCVWFEAITGVSCVGNTFIPGEVNLDSDLGSGLGTTGWVHYDGLDAQTVEKLQNVAHEAVIKYNNGDIIE